MRAEEEKFVKGRGKREEGEGWGEEGKNALRKEEIRKIGGRVPTESQGGLPRFPPLNSICPIDLPTQVEEIDVTI